MKKIFTSLMLLAALLCSTSSWAADYQIWVGGTQVTDANKSNINPSGKTAGTISFTGSNLIFDNVKMTSTGTACIRVSQSDVVVRFNGANTLSSNVNVIYATESTILTGKDDGTSSVSITCTSEDNHCGIWLKPSESGKRLSIWNLYMTVKSTNGWALYGYNDGNRANLYTSCAQISATSKSDRGAVAGFSSWSMDDNGYLANKCTYSTSNNRTVKDDGSSVANEISFYNGLYVGKAMVRVAATSSWEVNPAGKSAGSIKYANKVLTLDGVTYDASTVFVDNRNVPNLQIELKNTNTITTSGQNVFDIRAHTEFTGSGKLTASGSNGISIYGDTKVTVNVNNEVHFNGTSRGYFGYHNASERPNCDLILKKAGSSSDYYFKGTSYGAITDASHLTLTDMDFFYNDSYGTPACYFDPIDHRVETTGGTLVKETDVNFYRVITTYPIFVGGVQVTECNKNSIGSPYLTAGTVKYDSGAKKLTLTGASINVTDNNTNAILTNNGAGDLTILFDGTNDDADKQNLTANTDALDLGSNTTFTGGSKFYITSNNKSGISTRYGAAVTFNTTAFAEIKGAEFAYYGNGASTEKLTLKKAAGDKFGYRFVGEQGIIHNVTELVLDNMDFWQGYSEYLSGCYFDGRNLMQNGTEAKGQIAFGAIVEALPVWVCGKQLNKVSENTNYTIYVGSQYIKGGTKAVGYNPFTQTLTLNNATIAYEPNANTNDGIIQTNSGTTLNMNVKGTNTLSSTKSYSGLWLKNSTVTIDGDGKLTLNNGRSDDLYGLDGSTVKIQGDVTVEAVGQGIGSNNNMGELIMDGNAVLKAKHLHHLNKLTLNNGQAIVEPAGATFNSSTHQVELSGSAAQNVVIMKVENYGLAVCDVAVNSYNCNDILGDGKFTYDSESKTLTINNATFSNTSVSDVVENEGVDGLKINVQGTNTFTVKDNIFELKKNTTITGTGSIKGELTANNGYGIYMSASGITITLDGLTFEFTGQRAVGGSGSDLVINSGKLIYNPNSSGDATALQVNSLTLGAGMYITEPTGAEFKSGNIYVGADVYRGKVVIAGATAFDLAVGGKTVNDHNCVDVLGDGVFKYDDATKTLTISGDCSLDDWIINSSIPNLTIKVVGASKLTQTKYGTTLIRLFAPTTITGGKLTLDSSADAALGIYIEGADLTIKDADIELVGDYFQYGITGDSGSQLFIDNSNITARAHDAGAIYDWNGITLSNCFIDEPRPSMVLPTGIADGEGTIVGSGPEVQTVVIKAGEDVINYELAIADVTVNSANCADVLGNGVFAYDDASHTLTVKGNYESTITSGYLINANVPGGLTVKTDGLATFSMYYFLKSNTPITLDGCKLKLNLKDGGLGFYAQHTDMIIKNCELEFTGESVNYSITGEFDSQLTIDNSSIVAVGQNYGTIADWKSITLINCYVDEPRPSQIGDFGSESKAITDGEGTATVNVVIKTGEDAIENIDYQSDVKSDIYDVAGRKLNETRRGINIIRTSNGKTVKVLKK